MSSPSTRLLRRLVALAALAVLPALAVITYDQMVDRRLAQERMLDENVRLTRFAAAQQASVFSGAARLLDTLAQFPGLHTGVLTDCNSLLAAVLQGHPGYLDISVIGVDGTVLCAGKPAVVSLYVGDRPWFQRASRARTTIAGEYQFGVATGTPNIAVAKPLLNRGGELDRVLATGLDLGQFGRLASTIQLPAGGTLTLFDRNRTILAHYPASPSWVGRRIPSLERPLPNTPGSQDILEAAGIDGVRRLYVTVPVETGFDAGLYVSVGTEPAVMFAAASRLRRRQFALVALVALIALGVAVVGGRRFVLRPITALTETTKQIADGDLSARARLVSAAPGVSELGDAVNAMAVALEARERDSAALQERLRASEARYRLLFEESPQPMWVYERGTLRFLEVNDAAVHKYGYTRDEFLAMCLIDIRPEQDAARLLASAAEAPVGLEHAGRWRHRLKSGEIIDVDIVSHGLTFNGREARLVLAFDITERLRVEQQLREAQERLRFALEASHVGIWEVNLRTENAYWSESCEALHGLAPGAFAGTFEAFFNCIHPTDREAVQEQVGRAIRERQEVELEYRTRWPDGTEHLIASTGRFFYDDGGIPARGAGVAIDVTERRSLEEQFRQAQKMDAVGQLAGGIAHDFNNMLTAIIGNAEFVLEDLPAGNSCRPDVEEIQRAARRAADLTHQLLAFSRKQMLTPRVLHLGDVVSDVTPMLRRLIGEAINLKTVVTDRLRVRADAAQLEQVLVNLAVNARDAMPTGGRLTIETSDVMLDEAYARDHPTVRLGPYVMLAVSDSGHGMEAATQRRVFEPFFTTKPKGQGTGLGLATVYGIVKQSGGHIWLYSEVGQGTTFKIYLPQTDDAETDMPVATLDRSALRGDETILLVEDEDVVREFVHKVLGRYGYAVYSIAQPKQAATFGLAHQGKIDLILTDVVMPEMSGQEVAAQVQQRHAESKVLFMSGYTDNSIVHHGVLDAGMSFLQKPFSADALLTRVREVLNSQTTQG